MGNGIKMDRRKKELREMITPELRKNLTKQGELHKLNFYYVSPTSSFVSKYREIQVLQENERNFRKSFLLRIW